MLLNICNYCDKIIDRGDTVYRGYDKSFCSMVCRSTKINQIYNETANQQFSIQISTIPKSLEQPIQRHKSHAIITINQSPPLPNEIFNSNINETTLIKKDLDVPKITRIKFIFNKIKNCLCFIICVVSIYHINLYSMNYIL